MNPLFSYKELFSRAIRQKYILLILFLLCLCSTVCGIVLVKTPAFFDYHLKICDRFLDRVCYSDRSVAAICMERTFGCVMFLLLVCLGGLHPAALVLPSCALVFRAYNFGGTLAILFSVYRFSGAIVALVLYIPIHLMLDIVFLCGAMLCFSRAFCFRFCLADWKALGLDFALLCVLSLLICVAEGLLLCVLFHPFGNLI